MRSLFNLLVIIAIAFIAQSTLAGQITITKSGDSFNSFTAGNEDYKPSPVYEGGILLGDENHNSCPVYEFILPPKTHSSGNQIDYIKVRLVGDDYTNYSRANARIIVGADNYESSIQATVAWSWTDSLALGMLTNGTDESIFKVALIINDRYAKYDLEKIEVTYGYSNVSTNILDTWHNLYTARKSFQEFKDVTVPTWDAVSTSVDYLKEGVTQCRSFANNVSNIGSSTLYNALTSANSAVDDLVEIEGTLSGSFSIIPWITSYGIEVAMRSGVGSVSSVTDSFDNVLSNLNTLAGNYYLYAFDGDDVNADDYNNHLETYLLGLRSGSGGMPDLELDMATAADIFKTLYKNQKTDISEAMFYSLAPMCTPMISEGDVASITSSYLQEFSDYIDTLVLYNPDPVPDRPTLLFPANDTFAKGLVTFHWNESATATKFHLQISLNSSFSALVYELEESEYRTSAGFTSFTDNGSTKLYWRVKAGNSSGWSLYSDYRLFTSGCMNGDFDGDCEVDTDDLAILASHWLDTGCSSFDLCEGTDLVRSADVDLEDFAAFAKQWQKTAPEPPDGPIFLPIPESHFQRVPPSSGVNTTTFEMGNHFDVGSYFEKPVHTVTLDAFYMCKYEVTNDQYRDYLKAALSDNQIIVNNGVVYATSDTGKEKPYFSTREASSSSQISYNIGGTFYTQNHEGKMMNNHPVVMVSWYGAKAFCDYYGYRLPTEAQWECAARGGNLYYKYPWGTNSIDSTKCNYNMNNLLGFTSYPYTTPVGYYSSPTGFYDMAGNVWEWCSDWHGIYPSGSQTNPNGPTTGSFRVIRGGCWNNEAFDCRVAYRYFGNPYSHYSNFGFRVCLDQN